MSSDEMSPKDARGAQEDAPGAHGSKRDAGRRPPAVGSRAARLERADFAWHALEFPAVLSVLASLAYTSLGARVVRELAPLPEVLARRALARFDEVAAVWVSGSVPSLAGITDPMPALEHAHRAGRALGDEELVSLREFLLAVERIAEWMEDGRDAHKALAELVDEWPDPSPWRERIDATVDERGRVHDGASTLLGRLRREMQELSRSLDRGFSALLARPEIRSILSDVNPQRRGGRTVLAVKAKSAGRVPGIVHDRSQSEQTVFIEPRELVLHGNRLAECQADERREVERILLELTREILRDLSRIEFLASGVGDLELAMISARYAHDPLLRSAGGSSQRGARSALLPEGAAGAASLLLRSARHPLLVEEQRLGRLGEVVPIDLRLGDDFDVLILTGPNTGGKTLALKTAGVLALMTRCGLPIPCAEGSTVPLYDRIVADIGDEQEISQSLSTFSSHLKRIQHGVAHATRNTLVLLDELGAGTDPDEGAALSEAILELFLTRRSPTLASTHIGKLKEFAFRHARAENASVEFDTVTLAPCYRILVGTPGESGALVIARRLGLPHEIVDRAEERLVRRDAEVTEVMAEVRNARQQAEKVRSAAETRLEDVSRKSRELDQRLEEIDQRGQLLEAEAQRGIEERVRDARRKLEQVFALLEQLPPGSRREVTSALKAVDDDLSGAALSQRREAFLAGLSKGDFVYLPRYRQRCVVQKVDRAKREVAVRLGAMNVRVSFDEVTWYESL